MDALLLFKDDGGVAEKREPAGNRLRGFPGVRPDADTEIDMVESLETRDRDGRKFRG
jgi:hypothetical protein